MLGDPRPSAVLSKNNGLLSSSGTTYLNTLLDCLSNFTFWLKSFTNGNSFKFFELRWWSALITNYLSYWLWPTHVHIEKEMSLRSLNIKIFHQVYFMTSFLAINSKHIILKSVFVIINIFKLILFWFILVRLSFVQYTHTKHYNTLSI